MKKNRKFIIKIVFSIFLLLCVCVPFLVHKNNVNAETNITDLTGMTVTVPPGWTAPSNTGIFEINGFIGLVSPINEFDTLKIGYSGISAWSNSINALYNDEIVLSISNTTTSFIFSIIDGVDTTNHTLIQWLIDNNATFSGGTTPEPEPDPVYTISGQYQFNEEITWLYDISEQEGVLYLPFYVYNLDNSSRVNYGYMINKYNEVDGFNDFMYVNETASGTFAGQVAGYFTTNTTIRISKPIVYFYTAEVSEEVYNWLLANGQFINDPTSDPNNPDNPDSGNNPNNPNNPDFGTDTVRQIVNQVNAFLGIQILPGLSFRDILLICIALPLLIYILKVFLGG